jgi:ectoine hydroxylase-related dioxygenase (phytanoyl-CoA dioxygenase family)
VRRLLGRDRPLRVYHDILTCKLPDEVSIPTSYHQDGPNFPLDRNALTVWIALCEITPDMGPVQFYSGSHKCGLLGGIPFHSKFDLVDEYPELARFALSPAHHMQPGDATVHHSLTVHGASANSTPHQRWSFLTSYFPEGARYTGAPNHDCDGLDLRIGYEIEHPSFPRVD